MDEERRVKPGEGSGSEGEVWRRKTLSLWGVLMRVVYVRVEVVWELGMAEKVEVV